MPSRKTSYICAGNQREMLDEMLVKKDKRLVLEFVKLLGGVRVDFTAYFDQEEQVWRFRKQKVVMVVPEGGRGVVSDYREHKEKGGDGEFPEAVCA